MQEKRHSVLTRRAAIAGCVGGGLTATLYARWMKSGPGPSASPNRPLDASVTGTRIGCGYREIFHEGQSIQLCVSKGAAPSIGIVGLHAWSSHNTEFLTSTASVLTGIPGAVIACPEFGGMNNHPYAAGHLLQLGLV